MPGLTALPLHPAVVHFPIAGAFFAAAALLLAVASPRARSGGVTSAALLLVAAIGGGLASLVTGYFWADKEGYLAGGWGPIPGPKAVEGLAQRHALLALAAVVAMAVALVLALRSRRRGDAPAAALLVALLASALVAATGHLGGTMVFAPPLPGGVTAASPPP